MTTYPFDMQLVVDPFNTSNVVANGQIYVYDPGDEGNLAPLALTDPNGLPLTNPLMSNSNGFLPAFRASLPQVKWSGSGFSGYFDSYVGLRDEAVSAKDAALTSAAAAVEAAALAQAPTNAQVDAGINRANLPAQVAAQVAVAVVSEPIDVAVQSFIQDSASNTKAALNAAFAPQGFASPRQPADNKSGALDYRHEGTAGYLTHFVMGANSLALAGCYAAGTDLGLGDGFFVSHKNSGAGIRGVGHGGSSILQYMIGYGHSTLYNGEIYKGNQGIKLFAKIGEGFGDGVSTSGSTTFTSATANFTGADVGATISQTTSKGTLNVSGTIPSGATIVSVTNSTTVVLSAACTATGTGIPFLIGGRAPVSTQSMFTLYDTNGTTKRYEFALGKYTGIVPHEIQSNDVAVQSLLVKAASGQTAEIFTVLKDGNATGALSITAAGLMAARFGSSLTNAGNTASNAVSITNNGTVAHSLYITRASGQTGDQVRINDNAGAVQSRFDKDGTFMTKVTTAPVDAQLANGEVAIYFDSTNGAAKLKFKAKQADGTVRTGEVVLV